MIQIIPVNNKDKLCCFYKESGIEINENSKAVAAEENGKTTGCCLFDSDKTSVYIRKVVPTDDIMFADGLLRSALFYASEHGCTEAYYTNEAPEELLNKLGFIENSDNRQLKFLKIFQSCENCK